MVLTKKQKKQVIEFARKRPCDSIPRIVQIGGNGFTDTVLEFAVKRFEHCHAVRFRVMPRCPVPASVVMACVLNAFGEDYEIVTMDETDFILYAKKVLDSDAYR